MSLEQELARTARAKNVTVSLAESCTGGLASDLITNVPGSSAYFLGSVVCYSDRSKIELLGVKEATISVQGAVSEQTALEMAAGGQEPFPFQHRGVGHGHRRSRRGKAGKAGGAGVLWLR